MTLCDEVAFQCIHGAASAAELCEWPDEWSALPHSGPFKKCNEPLLDGCECEYTHPYS